MYQLPKTKICDCGRSCQVEQVLLDDSATDMKVGVATCDRCDNAHFLMVGPEDDCLFMAEYIASGALDLDKACHRSFG